MSFFDSQENVNERKRRSKSDLVNKVFSMNNFGKCKGSLLPDICDALHKCCSNLYYRSFLTTVDSMMSTLLPNV